MNISSRANVINPREALATFDLELSTSICVDKNMCVVSQDCKRMMNIIGRERIVEGSLTLPHRVHGMPWIADSSTPIAFINNRVATIV